MQLEPFQNFLVLRLLPPPQEPQARVQRVRLEERPSVHAEVLAVGPEARDVAVGQHVLVSRLQGFQVDLGEPLLLVRESAVLAYI